MKRLVYLTLFWSTIILSADPSLSRLIKELNLSSQDLIERSRKEIEVFVNSRLWSGGYFEADPTDISDPGTYNRLFPYKGGMAGGPYICYAECLVPNIAKMHHVLEIGPGRGAWTKAILNLGAGHITCVDALSAEHNNFWKYVGKSEKITYHQISDCSLDEVDDDSIDFVFSFGVFCHISPFVSYEYFKNIYSKMHSGGEGFVMFADYDKYNVFAGRRYLVKDDDFILLRMPIVPGRWYHMGIERLKETLIDLGYEVIKADVEVNKRDPIIHFRKK